MVLEIKVRVDTFRSDTRGIFIYTTLYLICYNFRQFVKWLFTNTINHVKIFTILRVYLGNKNPSDIGS